MIWTKILETKHVGARIRSLRTTKKLSQEEVAKRAGIAQETLSRLETGSSEVNPSLDMLNRLAKALGVGTRDVLPNTQFLKPERTEEELLIEDMAVRLWKWGKPDVIRLVYELVIKLTRGKGLLDSRPEPISFKEALEDKEEKQGEKS